MITSRKNPFVQRLVRYARESSARRTDGLLLAEGVRLVREALATPAGIVTLIHTPAAAQDPDGAGVIEAARTSGAAIVEMNASCYARFSRLRSPDGMAALVSFQPAALTALLSPTARLCVLAGVQNPGNAGGVVRTAEAAGASGVVFCGETTDPTHPALVRAAAGSAFRLPMACTDIPTFCSGCEKAGVRILVAVQDGAVEYRALDATPPVAIAVGSEGDGLPDALADAAAERIRIPMSGHVESLNAGVAAALLLYAARDSWA